MIYFACTKCDIETCGFSDIIFALNARSAYHLRSKYHAPKVHITRRKANITETDKFLLKLVGFLVEAAGIEPASKNQFIQLSPGADDC